MSEKATLTDEQIDRDALMAVAEAAREYRRSHNMDSLSCPECLALAAALDAWREGGDE